ncbi:SET domain-containing protein-lysine N-methyltransferase [Streptomyces sp. NBC_00648]|uniref:SET domain-containing protein-lysine N-methyltransferase n=1 Tax=Streptomyces sp. NBC_00648 TaxID=2975797 RepID=UPI002F9167BE
MTELASSLTEEQSTLVLVGALTEKAPRASRAETQVGVLRTAGEYALIACEPARAGALLFEVHGEPTNVPSRYSVQVGKDVHLDLPEGVGNEETMDAYFWRFMNHSCSPNSRIAGRQVLAATDIGAGDEITFHYSTTEFFMAEPFDCQCGSVNCAGHIAGFTMASDAERERLRPWLAQHLLTGSPAPVASAPEPVGPAAP